MAYELPELPYAYDALEPHIDSRTMEIHHSKHHAGYVSKVNAALDGSECGGQSVDDLISNLAGVSEDIRGAVRNNGCGHSNHSLFWSIMSAAGGGEPTGDLAAAINAACGSFDAFKEAFSKTAITTFGSGWAWLVKTKQSELELVSTSNAGCPLTEGHIPLLTCDVWEHAYYIDYRNARPKYVDEFWSIVNWDFVAQKFAG